MARASNGIAASIEELPAGALANKRCVITGATNGHGRAVAAALASLGAELVLLARNAERGQRVAREIADASGQSVEVCSCDLASREDVDRAAAALCADARPIHLLVNNAGAVFRRREHTIDGVEATFGVNYLAHFQLTLRLLPLLLAGQPARIVNIASDAHRLVRLDLDDLQGERKRYWLMGAYGRSKLALIYFTRELARRLARSGITVNACDPGPVASNIGQNNPGAAAELLRRVVMPLFFPSAARAAKTAVYLAAAREVAGATGGYYKWKKPRRPRLAADAEGVADRLWTLSAELTGADHDARH